MFSSFLVLFKLKFKLPLFIYRIFICLVKVYWHGRLTNFNFERFRDAQWFPNENLRIPKGLVHKKIDLVFVATQKDFEVLKLSLPLAASTIPENQLGVIQLVVPSVEVDLCRLTFGAFSPKLEVVDENHLLSIEDRENLFNKFQDRYTWVLQQLLKVASVLNSDSDAVLIVDADTLLLNRRAWLNPDGIQILQISEEYNADYYEFLSSIGIGGSSPKYTHITHHMLIQKKYLIEVLDRINTHNVSELVNLLAKSVTVKSKSPVCIDYELYAQYMMLEHRDKIILSRWCNLGVPLKFFEFITRSSFRIKLIGILFYSVSFHSWS